MTPRVLIVDDEPRLRDVMARAVKGMGFAVAAVPSAEAALAHLGQEAADIAVVDLNLPGMGGMELLAKLRRSHPALQVIILTGFGALEAAQQAMRLDAVDFLSKPCPLGDLEQALSRAQRRLRPPEVKPRLASLPADAPAAGGEEEDFEAQLPFCPALPEGEGPGPDAPLAEVEKFHILRTLAAHQGNRRAVAAQLGISLRTLYYRLRQYGL